MKDSQESGIVANLWGDPLVRKAVASVVIFAGAVAYSMLDDQPPSTNNNGQVVADAEMGRNGDVQQRANSEDCQSPVTKEMAEKWLAAGLGAPAEPNRFEYYSYWRLDYFRRAFNGVKEANLETTNALVDPSESLQKIRDSESAQQIVAEASAYLKSIGLGTNFIFGNLPTLANPSEDNIKALKRTVEPALMALSLFPPQTLNEIIAYVNFVDAQTINQPDANELRSVDRRYNLVVELSGTVPDSDNIYYRQKVAGNVFKWIAQKLYEQACGQDVIEDSLFKQISGDNYMMSTYDRQKLLGLGKMVTWGASWSSYWDGVESIYAAMFVDPRSKNLNREPTDAQLKVAVSLLRLDRAKPGLAAHFGALSPWFYQTEPLYFESNT